MKRRIRYIKILKLVAIIGTIMIFGIMIWELLFNMNNITYDKFGNECRGKIIKACGGKSYE